MQYKLLYIYDVKTSINYVLLLTIFVFLLQVIALWTYYIYGRYFNKNSQVSKIHSCLFYPVMLFLTAVIIMLVMAPFRNKEIREELAKLLKGKTAYYNNKKLQLLVVEGYVEKFHYGDTAKKIPESFEINKRRFVYSKGKFFTYNIFAKNGGVIKPARYLRLTYVYLDAFNGNIILKIEEDLEKTKAYLNKEE